MATGDILSVEVAAEGWHADITIAGFSPGATYSFGRDPITKAPTVNTPYLTVVSEGYNAAKVLGTTTRVVHLTEAVRVPATSGTIAGSFTSGAFANGETVTQATSGATAIVVGSQDFGTYLRVRTVTGTPNSSSVWTGGTSGATFTPSATFSAYADVRQVRDEVPTATGMRVRVALSDYVYDDDRNGGAGTSGTDPVFNAPAGWCKNAGVTPCAASFLRAVTNSSTQDYAKVILRWATMPDRLLNGAFAVECVAFHRHASDGQPVAAVEFILSDGTITPRSHVVTAMSLSTDADQLPVYACAENASNFTQNAVVTCRVIGYPKVGDADSIRDSATGTWHSLGLALANIPLGVCDKGNTYVGPNGGTFCAVDATLGNDTTGVAANSRAAAEAAPVATISKAYKKIQDFNNANYGRNTVDGGMILLNGGGHLYGVGGETIAAHTAVVCSITRASTSTRATAIITGPNATSRAGTRRSRLYDISITPSSATNQLIAFASSGYLQVEDCTITGLNGANRLISGTNGVPCVMWKNVSMADYSGGMVGGNDAESYLARSCTVTNATFAFSRIRAVLNCELITPPARTDSNFYRLDVGSWTDSGNVVVAYNRAYGLRTQAFNIQTGQTWSDIARVGNIFERIGARPESLVEVSDSVLTNYLDWHNTDAGERTNYESDITAPYVDRIFRINQFKHSSYRMLAYKADVNNSDGAITGVWSFSGYGVGSAGNNSEQSPDNYIPYFFGHRGTRATSAGYTADRSIAGDGSGNGDYTPALGSVLIGKVAVGEAPIPYDQTGAPIPNDGTGAAGALQREAAAMDTPPTITSASTKSGQVGIALSYTITATGTAPITFGVSGTLPAGVTFDGVNTISGTPTTAGVRVATITATNSAGEDSDTLTFTIADAPTPGPTSGNLSLFNQLAEAVGAAGGHRYNLDALNAISQQLTGSAGHTRNLAALNAIAGFYIGTPQSFTLNIDALNAITGKLGAASNNTRTVDALAGWLGKL